MTGGDLLREAAEELYAADPEEFIDRRGALVAGARAAGDAPAAKRIAALRKPTRSAWVLNQLVRTAPDAAAQLAELGAEFRAAQMSLDGAAIRELSVRRRRLIDALARQAFAVAGLQAPPASVTDEVTATLGAALADPQIAGELLAGTLARAVRSDGLGPPGAPMTLAASSSGRRSSLAGTAAAASAKPTAKANDSAVTRAQAARERRSQAIAEAERAAAEADQAADAAASAEREQELAVRLITEQLADARAGLADARVQARQAVTRQRQAHQALVRLRQ